MEKQKPYNPAVDILRTIAILAVILIHTTTKTIAVSHFDLNNISFAVFLNQAARFAVPLFFMISGFVLELSYPFHTNYIAYLKKRLSRIFVPYVFLSTIYFLFIYPKHGVVNYFLALIGGTASYQLYFIPALLIFYLIFPLIHKYYSVFSKKGVIILLGIVQILLLYIDYYVVTIPLFYPIIIAILNYYVFILGVVFSHHTDELSIFLKRWKNLIFALTLTLAFSVFLEGKNLYLKTHNYLYIYSQWRPSVLIYTIFIAGSLYELFNRDFSNVKIIKTFSRLSFFVFFIHIIIHEFIWQNFGANLYKITNGAIFRNPFYDPLYFITVAAISFTIAYIAHKIPYLSKLTG